nr:hypothetical protein [Microctonus hyperodae filamentous virus]
MVKKKWFLFYNTLLLFLTVVYLYTSAQYYYNTVNYVKYTLDNELHDTLPYQIWYDF